MAFLRTKEMAYKMIYTCTLNPAIDLFIETNELKPDAVNRTNSYDIQPNGKGVNVSFILKNLNVDNVALGVGGGFTNNFIEESLQARGIMTDFVHIDGISRINVFTRVLDTDLEYKQVNKGPEVIATKVAELLKRITEIKKADTLVISGSFSQGIEPTILEKIAEIANENQFKLVIDTSYKQVLDSLKYHPYLVKPNHEELLSWFGLPVTDDLDVLKKYAQKLLDLGVENVLLSIGKKGAIFMNHQTQIFGNAPEVKVVNTACSGDTMLGTFLAGLEQNLDSKVNLQKSLAAASSTAGRSGLTDFEDVADLMKHVIVKDI